MVTESPLTPAQTFRLYLARDVSAFIGIVALIVLSLFRLFNVGMMFMAISIVVAQRFQKRLPKVKPQMTARHNLIRFSFAASLYVAILVMGLIVALHKNSAGAWVGFGLTFVLCGAFVVNAHRSVYIAHE